VKKVLVFWAMTFLIKAYGQNEFAATGFYNDFKNVYADAQAGFRTNKGAKRNSEYAELQTEYQVKLMLSLADSGKIVFPNAGNPYAIYYFEPSKVRLKVDQRALNLQEAVLAVYEQPLYSRTETVLVKNRPLSNTWIFTTAEETRQSAALFRLSIYFDDGKYFLSFEIRGKNP
jgi:hypothetical protein